VVIAIIAILIALLLPFIKTRSPISPEPGSAKSNLRQIGFAIRMYCDDNKGRFPDPYTLGGAWFRRLVGRA